MEKAAFPQPEPIGRLESPAIVDDSDFESHEDDENVVHTPRSSHFGDTHPDLPPSYDESQAAHAEAQARSQSQLLPGGDDLSDVAEYRTELPPEPDIPPRETPSIHYKEDARPPSPTSGPSILLHQALDFTFEQPATDARYAHELTRPVAIPSLPANSDPVKFARFYATVLHSYSVAPAQLMDFIDGLNALCTACSASAAQLRSVDQAFALDDYTPIDSETLIPAYLTQTNTSFFAPRGLEARILTLSQLAALVNIPTDHGIRKNMLTDALHAHRAGSKLPSATHGAATATAQALEPYIEPLSFAVPEPRTQTDALNSVAARLASLTLSDSAPELRPHRRAYRTTSSSSAPAAAADAGPSHPPPRFAADAAPSGDAQLPFWHPASLARRATSIGEWGEKQGKFWEEWGNRHGKFWEEWGDRQGKMWDEWGHMQENKWSKLGEGVGKWWEKWGEDFERRMSGEGSCGIAGTGDRAGSGRGGGRGGGHGGGGGEQERVPGRWPEQDPEPEPEPERADAQPRVGMHGVFPLAPGPRGGMMHTGTHSHRARGGVFGPHGHIGHHHHAHTGPLFHGHVHPQFPARGGFGRSRFAGGHPGRGEDSARGHRGRGRFANYNTEPLPKNDEEVEDDDSDTTSISSFDSSSTAVSSNSLDPEAVFTQKVREIERLAAAARAKGKKKEDEIEKDRQKSLRKADEERSKAVAEIEKRRSKRDLKAGRKAWKREWKRNAKAEAKRFKKQFRAEKRALKAEKRNVRHGCEPGGGRENRDERRDRRRREWESRLETKQKQWELRREELERGRKMWEDRWEAMRRKHEKNWEERRAREQQDAAANPRGLEEREISALAGGVPGAWPDAQDQNALRDDTVLAGAEDILWIVIGNLEA